MPHSQRCETNSFDRIMHAHTSKHTHNTHCSAFAKVLHTHMTCFTVWTSISLPLLSSPLLSSRLLSSPAPRCLVSCHSLHPHRSYAAPYTRNETQHTANTRTMHVTSVHLAVRPTRRRSLQLRAGHRYDEYLTSCASCGRCCFWCLNCDGECVLLCLRASAFGISCY